MKKSSHNVSQIYQASKLTFYNMYRNRKLRLSPRNPSAGGATAYGY